MSYIIDSVRTAIGNYGGTLKDVRTDDLASIPIKELIKKTQIDPYHIDAVSYTHLTLPTILLV